MIPSDSLQQTSSSQSHKTYTNALVKLETMKQPREVREIKLTQDPENTANNNKKIQEDITE
jgi:hypothetical protein